MLNKILILPIIGLFILPASSVQALTLLDSPTDTLLENMASAESVDFNLDLDFETMNEQMEGPIKMHADIDGVWDKNGNDAFDLSFWASDSNEFNESHFSLVSTDNYIYFSEDKNTWYFADQIFSAHDYDEADTAVADLELELGKLFESGVIKYDAETVEYIGNTLAVRYAYQLDKEALLDYFESSGELSAMEMAELRDYITDNFTIDGYLWVDTAKMLPVMFTFNVTNKSSETNYTNFKITVLFKSFNKSVAVVEPKNAVPLEEYDSGKTEEFIMTSLEKTLDNIDSDGDGLTDDQEKTLWYTNEFKTDSDGDGYDDYTEVINGYDPNGVGKLDADGDGLTDYAELTIHWSDRYNADSDGDGYPDGLEIANGYDPNGPGRF